MRRGRGSALRSLAMLVFLAAALAPVSLAGAFVAAQGSPGDRLTDSDIDPLPGGGKQDARGVCSDGTTLWVVEERKGKLFAYTLQNDVPTRNAADDILIDFSSVSPQKEPAGCTAVGATLYVADDGKDKLIAYTHATGARDAAKDFGTLSVAGNERPTGVTSDGTTMWVADLMDNKLYAYVLADASRDEDKDIALHSENTNPVGLWTDGTTMWVADNLSKHFYAYTLTGGARDTDKEFAAATDTPNVQGIWSNGSVLWAVNRAKRQETGNKVLAYRMPVSASSDASLSALTLSGVTLTPAFASGTTAYTASVGHDVTQTTVTATTTDANASKSITPADADDKATGHQVTLAVDDTAITITVTAEDGTTTKTYTVTVTRAKSSDATLSALALSGATLTPAFASGTTAYTASVANTVTQTTVTATLTDTNASKSITPADADDKATGHQVTLAVGETTVSVTVTAEDGETTQTYTVIVTRAKSTDASLSALSLSEVTLSPAFASGTTTYTASVGHDVTQTTVAATTSDTNARAAITPADADTETTGHQVALAVGKTTVSVTVMAEDGTTTKTYTIEVTRAKSSDASLSALSLSGVTLSPPFSSAETDYMASVANTVTQTTVTATTKDANARAAITPADADTETTGHQVTLAVDDTAITITVTAEDGTTTKTYTVTVTRAKSSDATLSALSLSGVTLSPPFSSAETDYMASVANTVTQTTVTATASGTGASFVVKVNGVEDQDNIVPLAVGSTTISVEVMAQDGTTTQTYTVKVARAGSSEAGLSTLALSGVTLSPPFSSAKTDVHGVGRERRDADDGDGDGLGRQRRRGDNPGGRGCFHNRPSSHARRRRYEGHRHGHGRGRHNDEDLYRNRQTGGVIGRGPECIDAERGDAVAAIPDRDVGVHGVGRERRGADDGDGNGVGHQRRRGDNPGGRGYFHNRPSSHARRRRYRGHRHGHGGGRHNDEDLCRNRQTGGVIGRGLECIDAERGDAVAAIPDRDVGVHGIGGARRGADDGDGDGSALGG